MRRTKLEVLSETERIFAEQHHDIIYKFLGMKGYDPKEYYDVVLERYLLACQQYMVRKDLQEHVFDKIAWQHMNSAIGNHFKKMKTMKRNPVQGITSLDALISVNQSDVGMVDEIIPDLTSDIERNLVFTENDEMFLDAVSKLVTRDQAEIMRLVLDGYSEREIKRKFGIDRRKYNEHLAKIGEAIMSLSRKRTA
ncbi:MAG: hypothetical protein PHW34_07675 [Hespellia sp.]|nr:hypothetical protein [Hespellia sp.]